MRWMTADDAAWLLDMAREYDAIVWLTYNSDGYTQPLLMRRRWVH